MLCPDPSRGLELRPARPHSGRKLATAGCSAPQGGRKGGRLQGAQQGAPARSLLLLPSVPHAQRSRPRQAAECSVLFFWLKLSASLLCLGDPVQAEGSLPS